MKERKKQANKIWICLEAEVSILIPKSFPTPMKFTVFLTTEAFKFRKRLTMYQQIDMPLESIIQSINICNFFTSVITDGFYESSSDSKSFDFSMTPISTFADLNNVLAWADSILLWIFQLSPGWLAGWLVSWFLSTFVGYLMPNFFLMQVISSISNNSVYDEYTV